MEEGRQEETEIIVIKDMLQILESIHISLHECVPKKHFSTTTKRIGLTLMCPYRAHTNHTPEFFFPLDKSRVSHHLVEMEDFYNVNFHSGQPPAWPMHACHLGSGAYKKRRKLQTNQLGRRQPPPPPMTHYEA